MRQFSSEKPLKLGFMGSQDFSSYFLENLAKLDFIQISCVFTKAPKPAGRGRIIAKTSVHELAGVLNLRILTPPSLKNFDFESLDLDIILVVGYGLILPQAVLDYPRLGCINVHPSLLPKYRGASPIRRSIMAGDSRAGVCIMQMDAGLDTGPVIGQEEVMIGPNTDYLTLSNLLAKIGFELLVPILKSPENSILDAKIQSDIGISYAEKLKKPQDFWANGENLFELHNKIRALSDIGIWIKTPNFLNGIKIWQTEIEPNIDPLTMADENYQLILQNGGLYLKTKTEAIRVLKLQISGKRVVSAEEFIRGHSSYLK